MEPVSHYYFSHRLKLHFWDWGQNGKPVLLLVHGGLDHARNWDWVARALREHFHVYAVDLRGHGNSAWAPGAMYSIAEYTLDLSALADVIGQFPIFLIGHSLGGHNSVYTAVFDERIKAVVSSCGLDSFADYKGGDITGWTSTRYMPRLAQFKGRSSETPFDFDELLAAPW